MLRKRIQLGLLHTAIALTALPVDSTLNRVMIKELGISATLVAILITLPYLFAPMQLFIGAFADRNPLLQRRRTPYIALGLWLSVIGVALAPQAILLMPDNRNLGLALSMLAFGLWGTGFNFATVSYFSLASELSPPEQSSRTITVMYFMMIASVITGAIILGNLVDPYTPEALQQAVWLICFTALLIGGLGLLKLEPARQSLPGEYEHADWRKILGTLTSNKQARTFFIYLTLLLTAVLGQDVLLEPFGGEALGLSVAATTRLSSLYGVCFLLTLVLANPLERWTNKTFVAQIGSGAAIGAFSLLIIGGLIVSSPIFYGGVVLLGLAIGLATVSNHSLMLDMTTPQNVGLFIGAWGFATALARLLGSVMSGVVRDVVAQLTQVEVLGYLVVFGLNIAILMTSLYMLRRINLERFQQDTRQAFKVALE